MFLMTAKNNNMSKQQTFDLFEFVWKSFIPPKLTN